MYYRGAQAAIVAYDITSQDSFERAKAWVKELQHQGNPNIVIALAGNKLDLAADRAVATADAAAYARLHEVHLESVCLRADRRAGAMVKWRRSMKPN